MNEYFDRIHLNVCTIKVIFVPKTSAGVFLGNRLSTLADIQGFLYESHLTR